MIRRPGAGQHGSNATRQACTSARAAPRQLTVRLQTHHEAIQTARQRQETPEFEARTACVRTWTCLTLLDSAAHVLFRACLALEGMIVLIPDGQIFPLGSKLARDPLKAIISLLPADRHFTLLLQ